LTLDRVKVILVCISGRGLPTHQIRLKSENFLWMDICTDGWTDRPEFQSITSSLGDDLKTEISCSSSSEVPDSPHHTTTVLRPFFRDTLGEPVPERTSGLYGQGNTNRGRNTDHPAGHHSIWTNQCPPPPGWMPFLSPNQRCQSTEGK